MTMKTLTPSLFTVMMMFFFRRSGWPLLSLSLVIFLAVGPSNGQSNTNLTTTAADGTNFTNTTSTPTSYDCSEAKAEECLMDENRICDEEECGACADGYVEFPVEEVAGEEGAAAEGDEERIRPLTRACVPIENLQLGLFDKLFKPSYYYESSLEELEATEAAGSRLAILRENAEFVSRHNRQPTRSYTLALNEYSADTPQEATRLGGYVVPSDIEEGTSPVLKFLVAMELIEEAQAAAQAQPPPTRVDWVERGAVTSVKNQGRCGGCWSISIAGAIEGAAAIWSNFTYLQSISFQQLISCDKTNGGCNGGFPSSALAYANIRGTATLNDYKFTDGEKGDTTEECYIDQYPIAVDSNQGRAITYYGAVGDDTYDIRVQKMKQGLSKQPIAIAVKSECKTFKNYKSGVITDDEDCACSPADIEGCLDHAVLLVGYDDDPQDGSEPPYWKIKNSWGTDWGEDGYVRIAQGNPNAPAQNSWGLFGLLAEGVAPLQALNQTEQVYDEPQDVGRETWEKVLILAGVFLAAAGLGICLAIVKTKLCGTGDDDDKDVEPPTPPAAEPAANNGEQQNA